MNQRDLFGYVPQHVAPDPVQAFPHPFIHRVPTPNQLGAENLRQLVNCPDAQVGMPYQAIVDYHPQPLAVSNFHLSVSGSLLINDTWEIGSWICIP